MMDVETIPMILTCPSCGGRHIDEGEFATKVHHTHACQHCGMVWRPAIVPTVGVQFLPGFKNAASVETPKEGPRMCLPGEE
jgi:rubredoxin